jgi:ribonuclease HII
MLETSQLIIGIDDAGRGPVLGPMCLAGIIIRKETEKELKDSGVADSKLLTPKKRESLIENIKQKSLGWKTFLVTPAEIDTGFGMGLNLNQVEAFAAGSIINELTAKLSNEQKNNLKIILDCPSINTSKWKEQLLEYVKEKSLSKNILCEHKADFNYPVVSGASIIAKVTRDAEIEKIKQQIGIDFGSGYPSDPITIAFLKKHVHDFKKERIFRESWATWKEAALGSGSKNLEKKGKQSRLL